MTPAAMAGMRTIELPEPVLSPYGEAQIRFAIGAWPMRAAEEYRSALIFRALARAARAASVPEPWPARFIGALRDELAHAHLCASVGAKLGAARPVYDAHRVRQRLARVPDAMMRVVSLLLIEVAMGETISMYLFRAGRRAAMEPLTRAALSAILGDEARHQRLGWAGLGALWPTLTPSLRAFAQREAALGLAGCEQDTAVPAMRWLEKRLPFDASLAALGVLDPEVRVEGFYLAVERLVVPRLSRLGLDGTLAWKERYRPHPQSG
jgi:hypothetical protein